MFFGGRRDGCIGHWADYCEVLEERERERETGGRPGPVPKVRRNGEVGEELGEREREREG